MTFDWAQIIGGLLSGGLIMKGADMIFGRESRHVKALGDTITALSGQIEASDKRQDRFSERLDAAETKLEDCESKHAECEARVKAVGEELVEAKVEISRLMTAAVPSYAPKDLKRVARRKKP